tara:strand:+ start:338 stop:541 length:204 start_codon:yes stop_codon:yes gene_type:complete
MINEKTTEVIDEDLIIQFAENLIKEMGNFSVMGKKQAIHGASVASQKLAQVTGSKFYYEVTRYLMDL